MATVTAPRPSTELVARVAKRSLWMMRELPVVPLLVLALLTFVAIFAPVLAPHSKLDPVKPTKEQCMAQYEMANCPYVDNLPPFWLQHGSFHLPLGTDYLGRDILSRLMYGARISLVVALVGTLAAGVIGTWLGVLAGYLGG
jgi:peptide/nickel transport system permease protein